MPDRTRLALRWFGELLVIVVGVLVALGADRWNQARSEAGLEEQFLVRLASEVRGDSALIEDYLARLPAIMASRDTLLAFVDGAPPPDSWGPLLIVNASRPLVLPPPLAWTELNATTSLIIIRDATVREALSRYYTVDRREAEQRLEFLRLRRDGFFDALSGIGWIVPDGQGGQLPVDSAAFRRSPEMREQLIRLGSMHGGQQITAWRVVDATGAVLVHLEPRGH
jgi:hypothetical protein